MCVQVCKCGLVFDMHHLTVMLTELFTITLMQVSLVAEANCMLYS